MEKTCIHCKSKGPYSAKTFNFNKQMNGWLCKECQEIYSVKIYEFRCNFIHPDFMMTREEFLKLHKK